MSGNSFQDATPILVDSNVNTYSEAVDTLFDENDYWVFGLNQTSNFELSLTGLFSDADVELYDSSGNLIESSENSGFSDESISLELNSGTYFVRVFAFAGFTNYDLNLRASNNNQNDAGDTIDTARVIDLSSGQVTLNDAVGDLDLDDFYQFTLNQDSEFELNLTGLSSDADVRLLDSQGNFIDSSIRSGSQSEDISKSLTAGTYYINVYRYTGDTDYTLDITAIGNNQNDNDNAGNSINDARVIDVSSGQASFNDAVGDDDPNDYYRFTLNNTQDIEINLTGLSSDIDLRLLDGNGNLLDSSVLGGSNSEFIDSQLTAGTYYIRVYPFSGSSNYNLSVEIANSPTPNPDPNPPTNPFDSTIGFGFADAAAAVASGLNQPTFNDVDTFGGADDWNVNMVNAPEVWAQGFTGGGIVEKLSMLQSCSLS